MLEFLMPRAAEADESQPQRDNSNLALGFKWTDEKVDELRELHGRYSAAQIAKKIGAPTRNCVIGKALRLGLPKLRALTPYRPREKATNVSAQMNAEKGKHGGKRQGGGANGLIRNAPQPKADGWKARTLEPPAAATPGYFLAVAGKGRCMYPVEQRHGGHWFCGAPRQPAENDRQSPYCCGHHALCHTPAKPPKGGHFKVYIGPNR